jgi:hypothetical protein
MPSLSLLLLLLTTSGSVLAQNERNLGNYALDKKNAEAAAAAEYARTHPCAAEISNTSVTTSTIVCVTGTFNTTSFSHTVSFNGTLFNGTFFNSTFLNNTSLNGTNISCSNVFIQIGTVFNYRLSNGNHLVINTVLGQILPWSLCPRPLTPEEISAKNAEMQAKSDAQLRLAGWIILGIVLFFTMICCVLPRIFAYIKHLQDIARLERLSSPTYYVD